MIDLEKIKARAKEGLHYSKWLYVWELIAEVERLRNELQKYNPGPSNDDSVNLLRDS